MARERVENIKTLDKNLLEYKIETRIPKVPFGCLIEKGYVKIGESLYSRDGKRSAQVQADASLVADGIVGSIHKVSATLLNKTSNNGWDYWYVNRDNKLICINTLRYEYEKAYLKPTHKEYDLFQTQEECTHVCESNEDFLKYGNNEL